jgi:hypothetical protein
LNHSVSEKENAIMQQKYL